MRFPDSLKAVFLIAVLCVSHAKAQQTNPVDRQVANPITDTPNVNPISPDEYIAPPKKKPKNAKPKEGDEDEFVIYSERQTAEGEEGKRIIVYSGNVDIRFGEFRLQADKITLDEEKNLLVAEGSVVFDQGEDQRLTGTRGEFNFRTKLGKFVEATGFTNQTADGTIIYFSADRVERTGVNEVTVENGKFTACDETVPKWSFSAKKAVIKTGDKIKLKNAKFRVRDVPLVVLPYASIPIKRRDRSSGFLTPTFGSSSNKGFRVATAYYQTLGRSADVTFRVDLFGSRGVGFGFDARTRADARSFFNFGFYAVKDRIFGAKRDSENPDQGGSSAYAEGVHFFPKGFTAVANVRLYSNLAFRQVFSDGIQQIISPIEVSQAYVTKSWDDYTFNVLARSQVISIPNARIKTRNLPGINFEKRPSPLPFLKNVYFSFKTNLDRVVRRESVDDLTVFQRLVGSDPVSVATPAIRFDVYPQISVPFNFKYFSLTATAAARVTHYTNSFNDMRRLVGTDVTRKYGEFQLDFRPVALAKNYYGKTNAFRFRHVIEPFATYRLVKGINNFNRIVRYDYIDTQADTNEIEFGVTNRIFTRKYTEAVTDEAQKLLNEKAETEKSPIAVQPYEVFTFTVRGKYFFDPYFGGALVPGRRNQIEPITSLSFYTFGGVPRRFSPLNIDATYRPRRTIFVNTRLDVGIQGDGLRNVSATVGYDTKLLKFFQTFYYTRAVTLIPSFQKYNDPFGREAGTVRGAQWSPSIFIGDRDRGFYGGTSLFFDFENRRGTKTLPLVSSLFTLGYAFDCCAVTMQYYTFNVGVRRENRFVFSFRLNGIGSFGTEQIGQGLR